MDEDALTTNPDEPEALWETTLATVDGRPIRASRREVLDNQSVGPGQSVVGDRDRHAMDRAAHRPDERCAALPRRICNHRRRLGLSRNCAASSERKQRPEI